MIIYRVICYIALVILLFFIFPRPLSKWLAWVYLYAPNSTFRGLLLTSLLLFFIPVVVFLVVLHARIPSWRYASAFLDSSFFGLAIFNAFLGLGAVVIGCLTLIFSAPDTEQQISNSLHFLIAFELLLAYASNAHWLSKRDKGYKDEQSS